MKKIFVLIILLSSLNTFAQEFSIHGGGGFTSIRYKINPDVNPLNGYTQINPNVNSLNGYTLNFGIGYLFSLFDNVGLYIGAEPVIYHAKRSFDFKKIYYGREDMNGLTFDLHTDIDFTETHKMTFVNIPFMLQYHTAPKKRNYNKPEQGFYIMGGVKAAIPLSGRYISSYNTIKNRAWYPDLENWAGTQKFAGLGYFIGNTYEEDIDLRVTWMAAFETGYRRRLNNLLILYTGVYCDFGLSNSLKSGRASIQDEVINERLKQFTTIKFPDNMGIIAAGVKIRLAFSSNENKYPCKGLGY